MYPSRKRIKLTKSKRDSKSSFKNAAVGQCNSDSDSDVDTYKMAYRELLKTMQDANSKKSLSEEEKMTAIVQYYMDREKFTLIEPDKYHLYVVGFKEPFTFVVKIMAEDTVLIKRLLHPDTTCKHKMKSGCYSFTKFPSLKEKNTGRDLQILDCEVKGLHDGFKITWESISVDGSGSSSELDSDEEDLPEIPIELSLFFSINSFEK
ncbi:uncharacterized protein LOC135848216 [Planococcus citri]|uniref:uncharacterized protein LOC135848216 n=1 Tax=Planococcus citri TaxID=170843 RepID=UPI0031F9C2C0